MYLSRNRDSCYLRLILCGSFFVILSGCKTEVGRLNKAQDSGNVPVKLTDTDATIAPLKVGILGENLNLLISKNGFSRAELKKLFPDARFVEGGFFSKDQLVLNKEWKIMLTSEQRFKIPIAVAEPRSDELGFNENMGRIGEGGKNYQLEVFDPPEIPEEIVTVGEKLRYRGFILIHSERGEQPVDSVTK